MLFNSLEFAIFLIISFLVYWFLLAHRLKARNLFILIISYFFYGWWDYRFLVLIFISSLTDYLLGIKIYKTNNKRFKKHFLIISLLVNLGLLFTFKYFNFFVDSFNSIIEQIGFRSDIRTLRLILPVGISFYTFQTLSYTIDIYKKKLKPTYNIIEFFAFVSFFPQLVAGPIERAKNLLPQFSKIYKFNYEEFKDGIIQITWGLFKKVVIADNCAKYVEYIFNNYSTLNSITLILGVVYFAFQIYCDFSGYSDIAIGTSKLFGFKLSTNFNYPYFSENISEFWRRWHISLSTWFRDYVYIPLGGNRVKKYRYLLNIIIVFTVSGLWHGANWTFIFWGFLHGLFFILYYFLEKIDLLPKIRKYKIVNISITFTLVCVSWIFFRASNITQAFKYIHQIVTFNFYNISKYGLKLVPLLILFFAIEWISKNREHPLSSLQLKPIYRWTIYYLFLFSIYYFGNFSKSEFIYFQF